MLQQQIIKDVSVDLNDIDNTRWTQPQLLSYLIEALIALFEKDKRPLYKMVIISVEPGGGWQKACCCDEIISIVGESDAAGNIIRKIKKMSTANHFIWPDDIPPMCRPETTVGYMLNPSKKQYFSLVPAVKPGSRKFVVAECYGFFDIASARYPAFDVPDRFVQAVKQWMLYRALIVDSENNSAITTVAKTHLETYMALAQDIEKDFLLEKAEREKIETFSTSEKE